jgi:drug/metabolite transporter (DMT)-like permease
LELQHGTDVPDDHSVEAVHQRGGVERIAERYVDGVAQLGGEVGILVAVPPAGGRVGEVGSASTEASAALTWLGCTIGAVACLPFGPALVRETADARPSTIWWVVFLGAFPTALAFTTWAYALARTSAGRMGATTYLVPPLTILLAWLLLDETPATLAFAGGVLRLIGVAISRRGPKRPAATARR